MDDYAPVTSPFDEEEEERKRSPYPAATPAAVPGSPAAELASAPGYAPVSAPSNEELSTVGAGYAPVKPASNEELSTIGAPAPGEAKQRPQWKDYAPPERHGLAKFGSILAGINPVADRIVNQRPLQHAEEKYKNATAEFAGNEADQLEQARTEETQASAGEKRAKTREIEAGKPDKIGNTPEEVTIHDLMTGDNGRPRVNPDTGKPYSYLEAFQRVKQAAQDVKPEKDKTRPTERTVRIINGVPHEVLIDKVTGEDIKDLGQTKVAGDTSGKTTARSDKSYQYNNDKLDKMGAPVEQLAMRIGRLREALAQGTPQADALVAPELLTVMAGGQGSGLRMNEAEISRVIGGRSNWESLQAAVNKWRLDPSSARSITPAQQQQIRALTDAVFQKLLTKQHALDQAREHLLDSDDPQEHRRIVQQTHQHLTGIDEGTGGGGKEEGAGGTISIKAPNGKNYTFTDQKAADEFKKKAGIK